MRTKLKIGDQVRETWISSPDRTKVYTVTDIKPGRIYYSRSDVSYVEHENQLEKVINEFKKGDYIVVLKLGSLSTACAQENYCFKQREDDEYLCPTCDLDGDKNNTNMTLTFDKSDRLLDWRYATKKEIAKYNELGKPYDVTILNKTTMTTPEKLLEKAKRDYPIGTIYIGLRDNEPYTARKNPNWVPSGSNDYWGIEVGTDYVYKDGKWAKIVTKDIPEYVECVKGLGWGRTFKKGVIYDTKVELVSRSWKTRLEDWPNDFKPSTKEAFEKQNNKTVMSKQKLIVPVTDILKIHSIACGAWKSKIASDYLPRVNSDQNIKFSQTEVNSMFAAATASQLPVLEEVFGKQSKPIDWDKIKTGSQVMIKYSGEHCGGTDNIDLTQPVNVVFYNTRHLITSNSRFQNSGAYSKFCTFEQNGKFILFSANEETYKNYIVEVVQY